jgi:hypothetical protein
MSYLAACYLIVCFILYVCYYHKNSALLRHQQGLTLIGSVGGLEAFLTCLELTGRYQGKAS